MCAKTQIGTENWSTSLFRQSTHFVLCRNSEVLQSPTSSRHSTDGAGYKTLADKLLAFNEMNWLLSSIVPGKSRSLLEEFLKSHKAKWLIVHCWWERTMFFSVGNPPMIRNPFSTSLKNRILAHFPELPANEEGWDVLLIFREDIWSVMRKACELNADTGCIHLERAANIIHRDIFNTKTSFNSTFDSQCQELSLPNALLALVFMILYSPNIKTQSSYSSKLQAALALTQLLTFNTFAHCRDGDSHTFRHKQERETPLPLYVGVTDPQ